VALSLGGAADASKDQTGIPARGLDDIPIRDEIELTMELP